MHIEPLESRQYFTGQPPASYAYFIGTTLPPEVVAGSRIHAKVVVQWQAANYGHVRGAGDVKLYAWDGSESFLIREKSGHLNVGKRPRNWIIPVTKFPSNIPPGAYTLTLVSSDLGFTGGNSSPFSFTVIEPTHA